MRSTKNTITDICCFLLATLFFYAAVSKLFTYSTFRLQLARSPFIDAFAAPLALLLPLTEISISCALMFVTIRILALYASLFLLTLFTAYLLAVLHFSYYIPCSCGGIISALSWQQHIVMNAGFIIINLITIIISGNLQAEKCQSASLEH